MLSKIKNSINYNEILYLFWGILKRYVKLKNSLYILFDRAVRYKIKKNIKKNQFKKETFANHLSKILEDFSNYVDFVSPKEKKQILEKADSLLAHEFNILGSGAKKLDRINWHIDFKSGFIWPKGKFYTKYIQVDLNNNADVKVPRELSRSHHFLTLGQAYLLTRDEKYTNEFIDQVNDWIRENPLMRSINWGCAMDVAIRAVNWIYALNMFIKSPNIKDNFINMIITSLYEHGWFIYRNLEKNYKSNSNHYVADLVGLLFLGYFFKNFNKETIKWKKTAEYSLFHEIRHQVYPGGVIYEISINYIRLVSEFFIYSFILMKRNNFKIPSDIEYRIEKIFSFILYYTKPNGLAPIIGDQDDGRLLPFGIEKNIDHRYLLTLGTILFNRSEFKKFSDGFNSHAFFMMGKRAKTLYDKVDPTESPIKSKAFKDAGFFIMRKDDIYLFINNSGQGKYCDDPFVDGSHTHADLLSFELHIGKITYLVDPGSYIYTADAKMRNFFRSTQMHNTVVVDGKDQYEMKPENLFGFETIAYPKQNKWISNEDYDIFDGEHDGYNRLEEPVTHRRLIYFHKKKLLWNITDYFTGKGTHTFDLYFHFNSGIDFEIHNNEVCTILKDLPNICLSFDSSNQFELFKEKSWVSIKYGQKEDSYVLRILLKRQCPDEFSYMIYIK